MAGPGSLYKPMLATLGDLPQGPGWASEYKWDGVRAVAYLRTGTLRVMSRDDLDVTGRYPELAVLTVALRGRRAVLDGEVVALDDGGVPRPARLRHRTDVETPTSALVAEVPVTYHLFDVLALDGEPTIDLPYRRRRELLEGLGLDGPRVRIPPAFLDAEPADVYAAAVDNGHEGVVCKRLSSTYQPGCRSPDWIKVHSLPS